ncbi:G-protein coupled receptor 22-like [Erpetoichthys calabaricus]|uniref:G-protein coupled receptor 22 n=1 Tax=Erpetoichthys calabaricus TaxID=27687 RepID=A0A8C4TS05_ERPCA|nr:G-protein coupled receptor 22-like [Erpetoichthys calabaricus]XP_028680274.1 G-protein coupled receptor 22-like [Erpetoichthys calabaricus]
METDSYNELLETTDGSSPEVGWYLPYPVSFQVSLTSFLMLEIVLGFSSNLTVLVLYCMQSNLVDSVSNIVTMNLHVLDIIICVVCVPLTIVVILIPWEQNIALICCFHEACVTFTSISTAINVLVISMDRYDISVRPANRVLTPSRAILLLSCVWGVSLMVFFIPFFEVEFFGDEHHVQTWQNRTLLCVSRQDYHTELGMYYHLLIQIPIFFVAVAVMLVTYSRILHALNIKIGSHFKRSQRRRNSSTSKSKRKKRRKVSRQLATPSEAKCLSQPPLIPSQPPAMGVQASVSVIIALRRAVKRHRDRRERQKRVFKMSLIIISTFLACWAPISVVNILILCFGPSDWLVKLRICFLAMAYATTIFHPLLYAFTRQKLRKVLKSKMKKRVVSLLQVDPAPSGTVIHNSWVEPKKGRKLKLECSDATDRCLTDAVKD